MGAPNKRQLVGTVVALQGIIQEMFAAYANDVSQGRAERMEKLLREGTAIGQPVINAFPYDYPYQVRRLDRPSSIESEKE